MKHILALIAAAAAALSLAGPASAHPHVWVTTKSAVIFGADGSITGVRRAWQFDDMYSAFAVQGLEQKKKGEFTTQELEPLAKVCAMGVGMVFNYIGYRWLFRSR